MNNSLSYLVWHTGKQLEIILGVDSLTASKVRFHASLVLFKIWLDKALNNQIQLWN